MATQRRRGNSLELKAYAGTDPATGKPEYLYDRAPADTGKRELDRRLRALDARAADLAAGRRIRRKDPAAPRPVKVKAKTCGEALEVWWAKHGAKLASAPRVRTLVDNILLPEFGAVPVALMAGTAPDDEEDRDPDLVYLSERWKRIARERRLEASTVHRCHGMLGAALRRVGHPIPDPGLPPVGEGEPTMPLAEEMAAFLGLMGEPPVVDAYRVRRASGATYEVPAKAGERSAMDLMLECFALLVMSGPRPVEAAAITRERLDLERRRLSLDGRGVVLRLGEDGSEVWEVVGGETVKRRKRAITLDDRTVVVLRRWLAFQQEYALAVGVRPKARSLVFSLIADGSVPISPKVMSRAFSREVARARKAGLELPVGFHLYDMRHFGISQLLRAGRDVTAVANRFGTSARMIHQTYGHCIDADDSHLADTLGAMFPTAPGEIVRFPSVAGGGPSGG